MRQLKYYVACTVDRFIAHPDGTHDGFLMEGEHFADLIATFPAQFRDILGISGENKCFDTVLMGRRTYEVALRMGNGGPYPGLKTYIFSRTRKAGAQKKVKNVEFVSEDAAEFVRKLKSQKGKDICVMGGGLLAKSLFEADLIDEIGFNIHPVLLGSGIPLFYEMNRQIDLELIECKAFKNGTLMVSYRVKHETEKKKPTARKAKSASKAKLKSTEKS